MMSLCKDLGYLAPEIANHILGECINLNKMVYSLVSKIKKRNELAVEVAED
jgi:hypothetical protein